jgi:anti-anti-sigma factor
VSGSPGAYPHGQDGNGLRRDGVSALGDAVRCEASVDQVGGHEGYVAMEQELPQFGLTVRHHDEVATLSLRDELDLHAADQVRVVAAGLLDEGVRGIEIDAGELAFVDSSRFKAMLDVRHDAGERGVEVAVVAASERLRWIAQVTGVDGLLPTSG